jgi:tetratricopeptide (TPR) repeat protein
MSNTPITTLIDQAGKKYRSGKYAEAASLYSQAAAALTESGDSLAAAEMANNRSVALLQSGDAQGALNSAQDTDQIFALAGDTQRQALALGNQAAALQALNRNEEALTKYRECADLLKQTDEQDYRAHVLKSISVLQVKTGHQFEALASMNAALENKKKLSIQEKFIKKLIRIPFDMMRGGG